MYSDRNIINRWNVKDRFLDSRGSWDGQYFEQPQKLQVLFNRKNPLKKCIIFTINFHNFSQSLAAFVLDLPVANNVCFINSDSPN